MHSQSSATELQPQSFNIFFNSKSNSTSCYELREWRLLRRCPQTSLSSLRCILLHVLVDHLFVQHSLLWRGPRAFSNLRLHLEISLYPGIIQYGFSSHSLDLWV